MGTGRELFYTRKVDQTDQKFFPYPF